MTLPTLYYVHDPMCSWCWGFRPVWLQVQQALQGKVAIKTVLGGLAADTNLSMPDEMQANIKDNWRRIQQEIPGTEFNFDFWSNNQPRRSTYPACRAVLAAGMQNTSSDFLGSGASGGDVMGRQEKDNSKAMHLAIQQAYYLHAKNPSNNEVLIALASDIGLDTEQFSMDLISKECEQLLQQELLQTHNLSVTSFPSLVLNCNASNTMIYIDYNKSEAIVSSVIECLENSSAE